jgi:hypothetical protein
MGKSERKTINSKLRRKDKGATSNGERRGYITPKRSERKWWKADYTGDWYPWYHYNEVLGRHVEKCRNK